MIYNASVSQVVQNATKSYFNSVATKKKCFILLFFLQGYYDSYIMKCIEKCEKKPLLVGKYGVYGGIPNFRTPKQNQNWFEKME